MTSIIQKADQALDRFCQITLVVAVALMLSLTLLNIVLRWIGHSILWVEPFVRHLVFLAAFLGGSLAASRNSHIGIDIVSKILEARGSEKGLKILCLITAAASMIVVAWLAWASWEFMLSELEFGQEAFLGIHSGILVGIMPLGFAIIALRFLAVVTTLGKPSGKDITGS